MKPKLYQYEACPFCSKVRSTLQYKGVDFEKIEVHPLNKKEISFSEEYKKVPIYIDSQGKQINDSTEIMRRIDSEFPEKKIFKNDAEEEKWLEWSNALAKGLPTVIYNSVGNSLKSFDYITKVGKFNWFQKVMIKYSGAFVMTMVAKKIKEREGIESPENFVREKATEWVAGLHGKSFLGGESPSASDLAVYGVANSVTGLNAGALFEENSQFNNWMKRMRDAVSQKPAFSNA